MPRPVAFITALTIVLAALTCQTSVAQETYDALPDDFRIQVVSEAELQAAMDEEAARDYDATTTTNSGRFFAEVVLTLARRAQSADPHGPPLLLRHEDWYHTFLNAIGLEEPNVPIHVDLAYRNRQDVLIDYDIDAVVESVRGELPRLAVSVQLGWPEQDDLPSSYSFADTLSKPKLQITYHRLVRHRLLDFGDVVSYDEVTGMTGRPTTGFLAPFFRLIGEGRIDWSRIFIADDGMQITRGAAHKGPFSITETIHVRPDGSGDKGLPDDDPRWVEIEDRLKEKPRIEYREWRLPDFDKSW